MDADRLIVAEKEGERFARLRCAIRNDRLFPVEYTGVNGSAKVAAAADVTRQRWRRSGNGDAEL